MFAALNEEQQRRASAAIEKFDCHNWHTAAFMRTKAVRIPRVISHERSPDFSNHIGHRKCVDRGTMRFLNCREAQALKSSSDLLRKSYRYLLALHRQHA